MIEALDINERIEYTLKADKGDPKTIFVFRPLDSVEQMGLVEKDGSVKQGGEFIFPYLEKVIVEVKNFNFRGQPITEVKDILPKIKPDYLAELCKFSRNLNGIPEQEAKN